MTQQVFTLRSMASGAAFHRAYPRATQQAFLELAGDRRVLGIKDSAGDLPAFTRLLAIKEQRPDFRVLQGAQLLIAASLLLGADGLVPGLANVAPGLFVSAVRAASAGQIEEVRALQRRIESLMTLQSYGHWLPALKAAAASLGFGSGRVAPPLAPATPAQSAAIRAVLAEHGLMPSLSPIG